MDHFPPPSRPASFRPRHLVRLRSTPNRWPYSFGAAFCVAAPVAFGWSVGDVPAGLVASIGAFTALYGADRPYGNRALVLAATAAGLACAVGLGAWSQPFGRLGIATVVLVATCATFFCNALRIGPPGAYMFALAGAIGTGLPTQHLDWWHAALLVLAGGGFSTVVRVAGVLTDTRRPERTAVASAGTAVARFLKSVGGPDEDAARHAAAVSLHDTWTTLVSRQLARSADDGALTRLRSISRELHRLFVDGINAGGRFADRDALAARAHDLAAEARSKAAASTREEPEHLPLGKHGVAEALQESLAWPSPTLVASLRVGLAAAIAASVGAELDLERAYWIVAAAVLIVHQGWDWNRSLQRGLERIIGTLLGLALAGAVLWLAPQGLWLALTLAVLQFLICMLVVQNYALAVIFINGAAITMASGGYAVENIVELLWARAIDTIIGCAIGIGVLLVTAPRALTVPIPQELAAALDAAQQLLKFAAAGDAVSSGAKRSRRNLQHRAIALLTAYELGAGARQQDRRFAEGLWPAVVTAQRVLYRLLAFCWTLEEAGSDGAGNVALAAFGASGQASLNAALEGLSSAITLGRIVPIASDVPGFLKEDLEDLARSLVRQAECTEAASGQTGG